MDSINNTVSSNLRQLKGFKSDGCSGGMSLFWHTFFSKAPPWEMSCVKHDIAYWFGGTAKDRYNADLELRRDVTTRGYPIIAILMFYAVRIFGSFAWPFHLKWAKGKGVSEYIENSELEILLKKSMLKDIYNYVNSVSPQK